MEKVNRKTMLYKTGVEYGDYTVNHIIGCSHGCIYPCYAYMMAHRFGKAKTIEDWCEPVICENALDILKKELPKLSKKIKSVQLCFSTDPFMYRREDIKNISLEIIDTINLYDIPCYILTKGILPSELEKRSKINWYGITFVSYKEEFQHNYERAAAPLDERLASLKKLHENGCKTWVSIEPYPTPNIIDQDLDVLLEKIKFVDKIVFGRLHYNKKVSSFKGYKEYYNQCAQRVIEFCEANNIECHIKSKTISE
ncbi:MAG: hypothetical protein K2P14_11365 [Anaeroplasmataceae bacterium]|nr:hypothetical protein [Anaeroplasmataceae bacterium]